MARATHGGSVNDPARYNGGFVPGLLYVTVCQKIAHEFGILTDGARALPWNLRHLSKLGFLNLFQIRWKDVQSMRWDRSKAPSDCLGHQGFPIVELRCKWTNRR